MFDHKLRMLAFVERWNIAPRLHRQSVAARDASDQHLV